MADNSPAARRRRLNADADKQDAAARQHALERVGVTDKGWYNELTKRIEACKQAARDLRQQAGQITD